jgi:hypothetical protein
MKHALRWIPFATLCACAWLPGCSSQDQTVEAPQQKKAAAPTTATVTAKEIDHILSQADLDAKAKKQIDNTNADAEFEKLKKELETAK